MAPRSAPRGGIRSPTRPLFGHHPVPRPWMGLCSHATSGREITPSDGPFWGTPSRLLTVDPWRRRPLLPKRSGPRISGPSSSSGILGASTIRNGCLGIFSLATDRKRMLAGLLPTQHGTELLSRRRALPERRRNGRSLAGASARCQQKQAGRSPPALLSNVTSLSRRRRRRCRPSPACRHRGPYRSGPRAPACLRRRPSTRRWICAPSRKAAGRPGHGCGRP